MAENNRNLRVVVYGAGAIGGVVGGHLVRAGTEVIMIGRPSHVNTIREHGLRLVTPTGTHILKLAAVTAPDQIDFEPNDVVFLCVKGQDTEEALRDLRAAVKDIPVFCFQNGVRNEEIASKYFSTVYGVTVRCGSTFVTDGEVIARMDPPGWLVMGHYPVGTDDLVESVAAILRDAGFYVLVTPEAMLYKWGKLMHNLMNPVEAITNARGGENDRIVRAAQEEARQILIQAGIRWMSEKEMALQWPEITMITVQRRRSLPTIAQGSTWQSLASRRGTIETDFLNGEIVRLAKQLGKQAPINETLLRITQEMAANRELPGKYTPAELLGMLGPCGEWQGDRSIDLSS